MSHSASQPNNTGDEWKIPLTDCLHAAKEVITEVAEITKELAHEVKETIVGHEQDVVEKKVAKAIENFEDLKDQLADEEEELKEIQRREAVAANTQNLHEYDVLKNEERKKRRQEFETEAQIAEAAEEYKRLRTEQLHQKAEHEKMMQLTHADDQKAIITDMYSGP